MKSFLTAALAMLVTGVAQGQQALPPPAWPVPDIRPSGTKVQPATGVTLGAFNVIFEKTAFGDVLAALGPAPIAHRGDAGEYLMWVCYTLPAAGARVWLTSGELGGGEYIDGMVATQLEPIAAATPFCPTPARAVATFAVDNGIRLGETVDAVKGRLGTPNEAPGSVVYYLYEGKEGAFDIESVLALKIKQGRVMELHANYTATN